MSAQRDQATNDTDQLSNTVLWLLIDARGMAKRTELRLAEALYEAAVEEYGQDGVSVNDILGAQFIQPKLTWIVYTSTLQAKAKLVALGCVPVAGKLFSIKDFASSGKEQRSTRISIHGIPLHVKNEEIQQWLEEYMELGSAVKLHKVTKGADTSRFKSLYSGHRFCYAKNIMTPVPRYARYVMPDPLQAKQTYPELIEMNIVVFHDGQQVNCRVCHAKDHQADSCPESLARFRCFRCGSPGHFARECKTKFGPGDAETAQ